MSKTFIVAELSANHGHKLEVALESVRAAKEAGADAVKIDMITKYNAKGQETKVYSGKTADMIVTECKKHNDGKRHKPHVPYKSGGCK